MAAGQRAKKARAAGILLHGHKRAPGVYARFGVAECGALEANGAEFTTWSKYVSCPACRAVIQRRRDVAKARLAQIEGAACRS